MERQSYWYRRRMGVKYPEQFISMVIDGRFLSLSECLSIIFTGNYCNFVFFLISFFFVRVLGADQQANGCPRWYQKTYALQGAWRMPVHVYGKHFI